MADKKKRKSAAPPNESKADKFVRLAMARTNATIAKIRNVGKLANRSSYDFTAEQANQIVAALYGEVEKVQDGFAIALDKTATKSEKAAFAFGESEGT